MSLPKGGAWAALMSSQRNPSQLRHIYVLRLAIAALVALPAMGALPLDRLLKAVEERYNRVRTLQVSFEETYIAAGRPRQVERGTLYLRKPGRMRWDYIQPPGKLFISNGKDVIYYNPVTRQAEKIKIKESEDMRAPLAFLLGKLDFSRDFRNFTSRPDGPNTWVKADAKSDKLPYRQVEFLLTPEFVIKKLEITGFDNSVLKFAFEDEKVNPVLSDTLFQFVLPPGASFIPVSGD